MTLPTELTPDLIQAFYARLVVGPADGCWLQGDFSMARKGYPQWAHTFPDGTVKTIPAHRLAYRLFHGDIGPHQHVRHVCTASPWCLAPHHLRIGSPRDNYLDTIAAGRRRGPEPKYGEEKARQVRQLYKDGHTKRDIAHATATSMSFVDEVVTGKAWAHLGGKIERRTVYEADAKGRLVPRYEFVCEHPATSPLQDYEPIAAQGVGAPIDINLTDRNVADLRLFMSQGMHIARAARMFCLSTGLVEEIIAGKRFAHVPGPAPSRSGPLAKPRKRRHSTQTSSPDGNCAHQ